MFVALLTKLEPKMRFDSQLPVQVLTYVITRHNIVSEDLIPIVMPAIAAYLAAIGLGLWHLQQWARRLVIATSGFTVVLWLRALLIREWVLGEHLFRDELARQTVYFVILINLLIFFCLTVYPDVVEVFEDD